jgi:hypothetical protein
MTDCCTELLWCDTAAMYVHFSLRYKSEDAVSFVDIT